MPQILPFRPFLTFQQFIENMLHKNKDQQFSAYSHYILRTFHFIPSKISCSPNSPRYSSDILIQSGFLFYTHSATLSYFSHALIIFFVHFILFLQPSHALQNSPRYFSDILIQSIFLHRSHSVTLSYFLLTLFF